MEKLDSFFIYGSGGTRKTYIWKTIIIILGQKGLIVLSVASSRIVALLLPFGKTAHSMFKIPIDVDETSTCSITKQFELAQLIGEISFIIWDDAPMTHRYTLKQLSAPYVILAIKTKYLGEKW